MEHRAVPGMLMIFSVLLAGCGSRTQLPPPPPPAPTSTPDACSPENLPETVKLVNDYMRQFDDYSVLASNIVQSQVAMVIPPMQEIRREAEDQAIPACLFELKRLELFYMETTLQALIAFQSNAQVNKLTGAIVQSRRYHEDYGVELARLLGTTLTPAVTAPSGVATP